MGILNSLIKNFKAFGFFSDIYPKGEQKITQLEGKS